VLPATPSHVAIALGSNLGDRRGHLLWAVDQLRLRLSDLRLSPILETAPEGVTGEQPPYLNAVVTASTAMRPEALLQWLLSLEGARGRVRAGVNDARTLDLDLILYGNVAGVWPGLELPHPRFRQRGFVLEPLAALAPDWVDPLTGSTVGDLWRQLRERLS
jgi:2-amino-4-hydroxy-6-hydroxymethyldihydropteridine diphosphokinase